LFAFDFQDSHSLVWQILESIETLPIDFRLDKVAFDFEAKKIDRFLLDLLGVVLSAL
jgi:hypothetical protein